MLLKTNENRKVKIGRMVFLSLIIGILITAGFSFNAVLIDTTSSREEVDQNNELETAAPSQNLDFGPSPIHGTRTGNTNINVSAFGSFSPAYLGDQNLEFYFRVFESYEGEYYEDLGDPLPEGNINNKSLWNVMLDDMEFFYNNQPLSPVMWDSNRENADNNDGNGWLVFSFIDFYNDTNSIPENMFRFSVKSSGIRTGNYELRLTFKYQILRNYTGATNIYNWTSISGNEWITEVELLDFEVQSCMSSSLLPVAVDENNNVINSGRFFAGARNQKVRVFFDENYGSSLQNVNVTLAPPSFMELYGETSLAPMQTVSVKSLSSNTPFYWRVNINNSALPGIYPGTMDDGYVYYEYTRGDNGVSVTEVDTYPIDFIVDFTPLLIPPASNGMLGAVPVEHQILQGTTNTILTVDFTNNGNVDLFEVELGLDLSNSFLQAPYYYDAGAGDFKTEILVSDQSITELPIGDTGQAIFNITVFQDLPKGKYLVPIVYTGWYYNNGTLGDSTGWVRTTDFDFTMIRTTHNLQALDTRAHMAVEILNPTPHIAIEPRYVTTYVAGETNQVLDLTLLNYELYFFQNVTISISTGPESPFEYKIQDISQPNLPLKTYNYLSEGVVNSPSIDYFSILANVKQDANGFYSVPVTISGWDVYNDFFEITTTFDVSIVPELPEFIIFNPENSKVVPGENFTLEVTVQNIGGSDAHDLEMLFVGINEHSNTFSSKEIIHIGELPRDEFVVVKFNVTAHSNITLGPLYEVYLVFKYMDDIGTEYSFSDNSQIPVLIETYQPPPAPATEIFVVTQVHSKKVNPGAEVTLTISIKNMGTVDIVDSNTTLVSDSNLFTISLHDINSEFGKGNLGSLARDQEKQVTYTITVGKSAEHGAEYSFKLFIKYDDNFGNVVEYNTSDFHEITLQIAEKEPVEEEDRSNWELVSVGVLILIAVILFALLFGFFMIRAVASMGKKEEAAEEGEGDSAEEEMMEEEEEDIFNIEPDDDEPTSTATPSPKPKPKPALKAAPAKPAEPSPKSAVVPIPIPAATAKTTEDAEADDTAEPEPKPDDKE